MYVITMGDNGMLRDASPAASAFEVFLIPTRDEIALSSTHIVYAFKITRFEVSEGKTKDINRW